MIWWVDWCKVGDMNGAHTEDAADKALELAKKTADDLKATKNTLRTLIAWLNMELGSHNVTTLLDQLATKPKTKT